MDKVLNCEFIESEVDEPRFEHLNFLKEIVPSNGKLTIVVSLTSDTQNISVSLHVREMLEKNIGLENVKILTRVRQNQGIAELLREQSSDPKQMAIIPFGIAEEDCRYKTVIAPGREEIAREVHKEYQKMNAENISEPVGVTPDRFKNWADLSDERCESNRWQFDHLFVKIRVMDERLMDKEFANGDLIKYANEVDDESFLKKLEPHKDKLSRMEHSRWCADKRLNSWELGSDDEEGKKHPHLKPYDKLESDAQQKDKDTVDNMLRYIKILRNL